VPTMRIIKIEPGMIARLKKPHPCGGHQWQILRGGVDIKARCLTCGRIVTVPRHKFQRRVRDVDFPTEQQ
jgi:hypothetical protein